jgi:flagellar assembly protein FliH
MSDVRPGQRLSAYQRWELASLEEETPAAQQTPAEALDAVRAAAAREGHAAGYAEGAALARAEAETLHSLVAALEHELRACDARIAEGLLRLGLAIAGQLAREALAARPERVLPVIEEAVRALPGFSAGVELALNPEDAALVRKHLPERIEQAGWRVIEDRTIGRGGCRVETAAGAVDATLETRWQRIVATLGSDERWLA